MPIKLVLFSTRGVSLKTWDSVGMLQREIAIYKYLQDQGVKTTIITYGDASDLDYQSQIPGFKILCNRWNLPLKRYENWIPVLFSRYLRGADLMKTNQFNGSSIAFRAARFWRKPFIVRGGYLFSVHTANVFGETSLQTVDAIETEKSILPFADSVVVTAPFMKNYLSQQYCINPEQIEVIPNYVDTELFKPIPHAERNPRKICFLGRFEKQKTPLAMLEALEGLDVEIDLIGSGSLENEMRALVEKHNLNANFLGNIPNTRLPEIFNTSSIYLQPSQYEGHPKSIIEAMSCGLAVIGGNTTGTKEFIQHAHTGWLCEPTVEGIREAVLTLLEKPGLQQQLGKNARKFILQNNALQIIAEKELSLYRKILADKHV